MLIIWANGESCWVSAVGVTEEVPVVLRFFGVVALVNPEFCKAVLRADCRKLLAIPLMLVIIFLSAF